MIIQTIPNTLLIIVLYFYSCRKVCRTDPHALFLCRWISSSFLIRLPFVKRCLELSSKCFINRLVPAINSLISGLFFNRKVSNKSHLMNSTVDSNCPRNGPGYMCCHAWLILCSSLDQCLLRAMLRGKRYFKIED